MTVCKQCQPGEREWVGEGEGKMEEGELVIGTDIINGHCHSLIITAGFISQHSYVAITCQIVQTSGFKF